MTVAFYLTRPDSETPTSIFARISFSGYKLKYYIPESILPKFWNKSTQRAKETQKFIGYAQFNDRLNFLEGSMRTVFRKHLNDNNGDIPDAQTFKRLLDASIRKVESEDKKTKTFIGFFEYYIQQISSGGKVLPKTGKQYEKATIQIYKNTLRKIKDFSAFKKRQFDFADIDYQFYTEFNEYLTIDLQHSPNTIGKEWRRIKAVLNEATEMELNKNVKFKSRKFSVTNEETDSIFLKTEELKEIQEMDLIGNPRLDNIRDLFLVGCFTGLRYSDFSVLKEDQINEDGIIETKQKKTGDRLSIPVLPELRKILKKYNGSLPQTISNQKLNQYLKDLGKLIPCLNVPVTRTYTKAGKTVIDIKNKWELLCSHTARRSFATNFYKAGYSTLSIMKLTGHKSEKSFIRYIKLSNTEHAKMILMQHESKTSLKAV